MNTLFTRGMATATALTRAGRLREATSLIKALLLPGQRHLHRLNSDADVIEGEFTEVTPATPKRGTSKPGTSKSGTPKSGTPKPKSAKPNLATPKPRRARTTSTTPLAESLRKIAAGGMPARGPLAGTAGPLPQGAQFLSLTYAAAQGSRGYRLYIPANRPKGPMPLIIMLHGCTQTPEDFAIGTGMNALAEEFGVLVAYPAQPSAANAQKCWNWYRPEDQVRDRGEPALIAGLTRAIQRDHHGDPARTYIAGLSAGGAAAVVVAAAYPDVFSAVGVHSGLPAGGAHDIPSAFAAMRSGSRSAPHPGIVPTIVFHGTADSTVHPANGAAVLTQALHAMPGLRETTQAGVSEGGRRFRTTTHLNKDGHSLAEHWQIDGAGHAWAGGQPAGSYTDPMGPDASRQMLRFFLQHVRR